MGRTRLPPKICDHCGKQVLGKGPHKCLISNVQTHRRQQVLQRQHKEKQIRHCALNQSSSRVTQNSSDYFITGQYRYT